MSPDPRVAKLSTAPRIGIVGDLHGDIAHLVIVDNSMEAWEARVWTLAALGGANSIDRFIRSEGHTWRPEESISQTDLDTLGQNPADILIGHDAPLNVPTLDQGLAETHPRWPVSTLAYSAAGRATFHRRFMQVRPQLTFSGHYHRHIDEQITYSADGSPFETRVVVLDMAGPRTVSQAILNVPSLEIEHLLRDGTSLTGQEGRR